MANALFRLSVSVGTSRQGMFVLWGTYHRTHAAGIPLASLTRVGALEEDAGAPEGETAGAEWREEVEEAELEFAGEFACACMLVGVGRAVMIGLVVVMRHAVGRSMGWLVAVVALRLLLVSMAVHCERGCLISGRRSIDREEETRERS